MPKYSIIIVIILFNYFAIIFTAIPSPVDFLMHFLTVPNEPLIKKIK